METHTLQVILEHCFPPARLRRLLPHKPAGKDWYEAAADEILNETEIGQELSSILDSESRPQQSRIRAMKVSELRENLSLDFLEPGRNFGLILWALMSEERLSARNLADQLVRQYSQTNQNAKETSAISSNQNLPVSLDQQIAEMEETRKLDSTEADSTLDELDIQSFLGELEKQDDSDEEDNEEFDIDALLNEQVIDEPSPLDASLQTEKAIYPQTEYGEDNLSPYIEEEENEGIEIEQDHFDELSLDGISLFEDREPLPISSRNREPGSMESDENDHATFTPSFPMDETIMSSPSNENQTSHIKDNASTFTPVIPPQNESISHSPTPSVPSIQLGGITISLHSLKRACESVFNETVELVTDDNLIQQDQIVVVGRQCGVRILHGPTWSQPVEPKPKSSGEPITIQPNSLKLALSIIHDEPVELVPDQNLLAKGQILFAGKKTGLSIMENERVRVPLPDWAIGKLQPETPPPTEASQQAAQVSAIKIEYLHETIEECRNQIQELQSRLEILEKTPIPSPHIETRTIQEPPPIEPLREEIQAILDGHVVEVPPVSIEEMKADRFEANVEVEPQSTLEANPIESIASIAVEAQDQDSLLDTFSEEIAAEPTDMEDILDRDILQSVMDVRAEAIATEEKQTIEEQTTLEDNEFLLEADTPPSMIDEFQLEDLDLKELMEEPGDTEIAEIGENSLGDSLADISEIEGLDLSGLGPIEEGLSLDGLEELQHDPVPTQKHRPQGTETQEEDSFNLDGISPGDDLELSLEDLNLEDLEEYGIGGGEEKESKTEESIGNDLDLDDVDLDDILSALDSEEDETTEIPESVFHGETILLLGGEAKNKKDYKRVIEEIGGNCLWYANLNELPEGEIAGLVEQADFIMTLSAEALSDPGILQATNYAEEQKKTVVQHHSSNPVSIQKQLIKQMHEGKKE